MKNCGRIAEHNLREEIEIIDGCESLDDLEQTLRFFFARIIFEQSVPDEMVKNDVRALLRHSRETVRRIGNGHRHTEEGQL